MGVAGNFQDEPDVVGQRALDGSQRCRGGPQGVKERAAPGRVRPAPYVRFELPHEAGKRPMLPLGLARADVPCPVRPHLHHCQRVTRIWRMIGIKMGQYGHDAEECRWRRGWGYGIQSLA